MTATVEGPTRPAVDVLGWLRRNWWAPAGVVLLVGVVVYQRATAEPAALPAPDPVMVERTPPTTVPAPKLDPLANFSKQPSPLTQALVGSAFEDKAELARRVNELLGQGLDQCAIYLGSDGVSWSVSAVWSAAHPSPVFGGCAFPPAVKP